MTTQMLLNCAKILAVVFLVSSSVVSAATCTFQDPASGASFDLSGLTRKDKDYSYPDPTGDWTWTMNVCAASNYGGDCTSQGWGACMTNGVRTISLGTWDDTVTWQLIDKFNPNKGVQATLLNGNKCSMPGGKPQARTVIMQFTCPGPETGTFTATENLVACQDMIVFPTEKACPLSSPTPAGGLSDGSVFLIILLVGVIVYVVGGCFYKRKVKGTLGREACPNYDFWMALPGLVRDGCRYTANKLKTGCKGGSPQYDTL